MKNEKWVERTLSTLTAIFGITMAMAGLSLFMELLAKAPEYTAVIVSAGMIALAIYKRPSPKIYNLTMPHPQTMDILEKLNRVSDKDAGR